MDEALRAADPDADRPLADRPDRAARPARLDLLGELAALRRDRAARSLADLARGPVASSGSATTIDEAVDEICHFYPRYHSMRYVGRRLVLRLTSPVTDDELADLNREFADIISGAPIERTEASAGEVDDDDVPDLPRIAFGFDRRSFARLRHLIDRLNENAPPEPPPASPTPAPSTGFGPQLP